MKKEINPIQKDYSFLQTMSTEELQELLRRDMDLNQDESDLDLVLKALEVLEGREEESESEIDKEKALNELREKIKRREEMFADSEPVERSTIFDAKSIRKKHTWLRIASIAAVFVLIITVGFTAADAMGHDLWGGVVKWTKETFRFGDNTSAFSPNEAFDKLKEVLEENGISFPVLPNWLPEQYSVDIVRVFDDPAGCRIIALATSAENSMCFQLTQYNGNELIERLYETDGDSIQEYIVRGITHYTMFNEGAVQIIWARENCQIVIEFSDSTMDYERVIDSIYNE